MKKTEPSLVGIFLGKDSRGVFDSEVHDLQLRVNVRHAEGLEEHHIEGNQRLLEGQPSRKHVRSIQPVLLEETTCFIANTAESAGGQTVNGV